MTAAGHLYGKDNCPTPATNLFLGYGYDSTLNDLCVQDVNAQKEIVGGRPCVGLMRNLRIANNVATPNTKIDFGPANLGSFWEVTLEDGSSPPRTWLARQTSTLTCNLATVGENGIDTGALANNSCYFLFVIAKPNNTIGTVGSLSSSAPILPAGYTYKALVGALFTNGSAQLQRYLQIDNRAEIVATTVLNNLGPSVAGTLQSLSLSTVVPSIAQAVSGIFGSGLSGNGADIVLASDANGCGKKKLFDPFGNTTISEAYYASAEFTDLLLATPQTLYWTSPINTNAKNRIDITGWRYGC